MTVIALKPASEVSLNEAKRVLTDEAHALTHLASMLDENFKKAIECLESRTGRIIITGIGKSGHVGGKMAATFASTGAASFFIHPAEASHGDLGMITEDDAVIALSNSGETKELSDMVHYCKRYNIPLICMVSKPESTLAKASDIVLNTHISTEACPVGKAPMTSTTVTMALGDALAATLMHRKGFKAEDFHKFHPGGKLGSQMLSVRDIMATGTELPLVKEGASMADTLLEMTEKNLGGVGVINDAGILKGMITDGDLKRHMGEGLLEKTVEDVMTENPITISDEALAVEAVKLMTSPPNKTAIFVVDTKNTVKGLIHIHHCLQAGVI
ncbi:MAG: KpsF/GutQ family sugar-phosphate isomerase [Alphaproteobacteria bacterium]|jgi:arabinose-5-phosphate isomerase|nr:KpsF/GutQ family sugar-phosphate isomerase [Alphaproteobacteria bacterium]